MKKVLAGCAVVLVSGIVAVVVALYFGYRAAQPMLHSARESIGRLSELAGIDDKVAVKTDYVAPANSELTEAQVARFVAVQAQVQKTLGARWTDFQTRGTALKNQLETDKRQLSFSEMTSLFADFGGIIVDARRAQVDALNRHQFSSEEYRWVKMRVYEAAGVELAGSIDWSGLSKMAEAGAAKAGVEVPQMPSLPASSVPEKNRALVKPHTAQLKEWLPLAVLGL